MVLAKWNGYVDKDIFKLEEEPEEPLNTPSVLLIHVKEIHKHILTKWNLIDTKIAFTE